MKLGEKRPGSRPDLKNNRFLQPAKDNPRRCQYVGGCKKWAIRGSNLCLRHRSNNNHPLESRATRCILNKKVRLKRYPFVYSKFLSDTLKERMEAYAGAAVYDITPELRLMRVTCEETAQVYDAVCSENASAESRAAAGALFREAAREVVDACKKAIEIEATRNDRVSVSNLGVLVNQIVDMAYEAFGEDDIPKVKEFVKLIQELRLPNENQGTKITPDQIVLAMDRTIPNEPDDVA